MAGNGGWQDPSPPQSPFGAQPPSNRVRNGCLAAGGIFAISMAIAALVIVLLILAVLFALSSICSGMK